MLKWTASAQKLTREISLSPHTAPTMCTPRFAEKKRRKRRATIANNKENMHILTSTPVAQRARNSPLVLAPLADILNVTPESEVSRAPATRRLSVNVLHNTNNAVATRRHSTVGFVVPARPQYAATLPKYEEEYSPSTELPTGQQLALRGLLPDAFMGNPRYFTTPHHISSEDPEVHRIPMLPKKRKLELEFAAIAQEQAAALESVSLKSDLNNTELTSNKMDDQALDNLIDAILDSARKEEKKKKPRKSFNLRRRTLLKNQVEHNQDVVLSPSYTAGDDPCNDVSFLNSESFSCLKATATTPQPATPILNTQHQFNTKLLAQLPTPPVAKLRDSFSLDTPVRSKLKRRSELNARAPESNAKKYKMDSDKYFEIGVALPSVYV